MLSRQGVKPDTAAGQESEKVSVMESAWRLGLARSSTRIIRGLMGRNSHPFINAGRYAAVLILLVIFAVARPAWATNWFIDPAATGSNNGTSWTNAWETIGAFNSACNSVQPGDTVFLSGGSTSQTYNTGTTGFQLCKSGTSGNPITFAWSSDSGHNGQIILDSQGTANPIFSNAGGGSWTNVTGNASGGACTSSNACKFTMQNGNVSGNFFLIDLDGGGAGSQITHLHVSYVEVKKAGTGWHSSWINNSEFDHSYVHDITCDGALEFNGSVGQYSGDLSATNLYNQGVLIHDNEIQVNNHQTNDGFGPDAIQGTHGISVYNNLIYGALGSSGVCGSPNHQDAVQIGGAYYLVYNNTIYCTANSVAESDTADTVTGYYRFYNNDIRQCSQQLNSHGIDLKIYASVTALHDIRVMNNTFTDYAGFLAVYIFPNSTGVNSTIDTSLIQNNIIFNSGPYNISFAGWCGAGLIIDSNNINAGSTGSTVGTCNGSAYSDTNRQTAAPTFVIYNAYAPTTNNTRITAFSTPDIGTGVNLSAFFTTDKDGNSRPAPATAWDLGAYNSGTTPPSPQILTTNIPNGVVGVAYPSTTMSATGGTTPYTWSGTGMAPGLSISTAGVITGTPTTAGSYTENITVTDAHSVMATKPFNVVISPPGGTPGGTINQGVGQQGTAVTLNVPAPPTNLAAMIE